MTDKTTKKSGIAAIFRLCPARHLIALVSAVLIMLHLLTRNCKPLMSFLTRKLVRPIHTALARMSALLPFSLAEILVLAFVLGLLLYVLVSALCLAGAERKGEKVYIIFATIFSALLTVYALFCFLWGVYYYGDSFSDSIGLKDDPVSVEQLITVTEYFAGLSNEYCTQVPRDEAGICIIDREAVLERSAHIYEDAELLFPCLEGPDVAAKGLGCSKLLSCMDYTGFFFPFTGEANVNTHFPPSLFPATVAHELAHQRGVAQEQQANFTAVLASLESGDPEYCYSAALMAYIHLGNALYSVDREAWQRIYEGLEREVHLDFAVNEHYWEQFESPVQDISNAVYEGFLQSYDQELGLKSYGACVDLLVNYYYDTAAAAQKT